MIDLTNGNIQQKIDMQMDGRTDGRMDRQTGRQIAAVKATPTHDLMYHRLKCSSILCHSQDNQHVRVHCRVYCANPPH